MGLDALFLSDGGKIVYVEGRSYEVIMREWMASMFPNEGHRYQVVALGGCGKLGEEFVKPILAVYAPRVFVLLDSDRSSRDEAMKAHIARLGKWLSEHRIAHHVLGKRELENYIDSELIAEPAGIHASAPRGCTRARGLVRY